jgi:hypothetical protein
MFEKFFGNDDAAQHHNDWYDPQYQPPAPHHASFVHEGASALLAPMHPPG